LVAGSLLAAVGIEVFAEGIEVFAEGIENTVESTVEVEHNLFVEQVCQHCWIEVDRTQHRNLRLDYSAVHNWRKWEQVVLLKHQV
jgi:hypothetical protein